MDIIIIFTIFIAITRSELCRRKSPIYHDTGKNLNLKGVFKYNYTVNMNITVSTDIANGKNTENRKNINKNIIKTLLLYNNSMISQFVNDTGDRAYFNLPVMEHVSYVDNGCNNVTVDEVIIYNFSVGNGDKVGKSSQARSVIPITFKGVSTHEPYTNSDKFIECIKKIVAKGCQSPKDKVKIDTSIISNCKSCTLSLMVEVAGIPEEFNTTLRENGATPDTLSELLYACMMTNRKDCIDYVAPIERFQSDTLLSLSSYIKQNNHRVKRDSSTNVDMTMEDIRCMYSMYDNRKKEDEFVTCMVTSNSRSKRGTSEDENNPDDIEMSQYLKKIMRIEEVIPREATHLQLGVSTSYSQESSIQVAGDINILAKVKDRAKKTLQSFLPNIPVNTPTDEIYDKINRPTSRNQVPEDSKNILSGRLAAITARKIESVRGVLESRIGYSSSNTEDAGYVELQFKGASAGASALYEYEEEDIQMVESYVRRGHTRRRTADNLVENIGAYRQKGGKGVHVVSTVSDTSTGLFDVDTSTLIVSPLTRKGAIIKRNTRSKYKNLRELVDSTVTPPTTSRIDRRDYSESPRYHSPSHRRCKRGTNDAVCAILGRRSRTNSNSNQGSQDSFQDHHPYIDYQTASRFMSDIAGVNNQPPVYMNLQERDNDHVAAARAMGIRTGSRTDDNRRDYIPLQQRNTGQRVSDRTHASIVVPQNRYDRISHPPRRVYEEFLPLDHPDAHRPPLPPRVPIPPPIPPRIPLHQGRPLHPIQHIYNNDDIVARPNLIPISLSPSHHSSYDMINSMHSDSYYSIQDSQDTGQRPLPRIPGRSRSYSSSDHIYDVMYESIDSHDNIYYSIGSSSGRGSSGRSNSGTSLHRSVSSTRSSYTESMQRIKTSVDKAMIFGLAIQTMSMNTINRQSRLQRIEEGFRDDTEAVIEAVSTALSSVGTSMATAGIVTSPYLSFAGMGLSLIAGLIDIGKDIYYSLSGTKKPIDPLVRKFSMYNDIVADTARTGVRKCLMPGSDLTIFLSYRSDTSFMPQIEKLATYFIDTIDSVLYYLNTSGIIVDFSLTLACPIGHLRSTTLDITAYTNLKFTTDEGIKFYQFVGIAAMLSKFPTVELTCGKDITLTLKPFEVKMTNMQLLKMATPGEPPATKKFPSNVCDLFPMKNFYLLVKGCPYDASQTSITRTTCSILLKMTTWDDKNQRWVLENPFERNNKHRQLFTFSTYDFNKTIIKPNEIQGHAKYCANKHIKECYWVDVMILDDITSCASRVRTLYVEVYTFDSNAGFNSFVLTCPSGSTPVAVGNTTGLIELPLSDFFSVKMFASVEERSGVAVFCVHNDDSRYKSDILMISFVKPVYQKEAVLVDNYKGKRKIFDDLVRGRMPWRSRTCVTWKQGRTCIGYYGRVTVWPPDFLLQIDTGNELLITEKYDPSTVDATNLEKVITRFPYELDVTFSVSDLGRAYDDPNRFWDDAKKQLRTYSSILLLLLPCTTRANILIYDSNVIISILGYMQSQTNDYGDGNKYTFKHMEGSECTATLDLTLKSISMRCPMFTIPRNISKYEGLCFVTVTSKDHCAIKNDEYKKYGYPSNKADKVRHCGVYTWPDEEDPGHYCGYVSTLNHVTYKHPEYEACKSTILVYYVDTWIESIVLDKPPYIFDFKYDKRSNNEYVDKQLSDTLKTLYDDNLKLIEYRDGSLSKSINRLSEALTGEARSITDVSVDSDLIEISYSADQEKILEIEERIKETTEEVITSTLSDDDLEEIFYDDNEKCCILDLEKKLAVKLYVEENYTCGLLEDFCYEHGKQIFLLVNNTFIDYKLVSIAGMPIITCFYPTIVPLLPATIRKVEDSIMLYAIEEGIQELLYDLDYNISVALLTSELSYTR
uniref:B22R-like protein n=1 Tax=Apapanepox virus TaxID=3049969 RepID=A0AAT9UQL1_9POXV